MSDLLELETLVVGITAKQHSCGSENCRDVITGETGSSKSCERTTALLDGRVARRVLDASVTEAVRRSSSESLPYDVTSADRA